jgi:hypothetical protein
MGVPGLCPWAGCRREQEWSNSCRGVRLSSTINTPAEAIMTRTLKRYVRACVLLVLSVLGMRMAHAQGHRIALVFSVEEAFVNSPVQNRDKVGLTRVAEALARLQNRYDVYVTLVPSQTDQSKLFFALDIFAAAHIPFYLDAWSSDTKAPPRPANDPVNTPFDKSHGLTRSIKQLQDIKNRYGASFAGIRLHEVFAANLTISLYHVGIVWNPSRVENFPADSWFKKSTLEDFFRFAARNRMKIIFSDPWWWASGNHDLHNPAVHQMENEEDLSDVMQQYPGIASLMYANNEPYKKKPDPLYARIDGWPSLFPRKALRYATGFGLSDQAWVCDRIKVPEAQCPSRVVADWAAQAIEQGATSIEFEPYWYFFDFPRPAKDQNNYLSYDDYARRGTPTDNFKVLMAAMDRQISMRP